MALYPKANDWANAHSVETLRFRNARTIRKHKSTNQDDGIDVL